MNDPARTPRRWAYGPWPTWRAEMSWNVTAKNYSSAAWLAGLIGAVLALPPMARLIGVPGHRSLALVGTFVAVMVVNGHWVVSRARSDRRWFQFMMWSDVTTGLVVVVGLVVASGDVRSPLWTCAVLYATFNGSDYDVGPSIAVLLAHALSPLLAIPLFAIQGAALIDAVAGCALFAVLCAVGYHYCALRSVVVRASIADHDALRDELAAAREREQRTRIARDLHDAVGSSLSLATVYADLLARAPDHQTSQQLAQVLAATTRTGLVDLRRTVRTLDERDPPPARRDQALEYTERDTSPARLDEALEAYDERDTSPARLDEALEAYAKRATAGGVRIEVTTCGGAGVTPARTHHGLLRIFQEALQNCVRHAHATRFTAQLDNTVSGRLKLVLADDGRGFELATARVGKGLRNIQERARELGGETRIVSSSGGTQIIVEVPAA